jgi:hypothetical protein
MPIFLSIRQAKQQKIYICNDKVQHVAKRLFQIHDCVTIDSTNWFQNDYTKILQQCKATVKDPHRVIFMISAGMGGKPLIADLLQALPHAIILDIGSGFDFLCTLKKTRDYQKAFSLEDVKKLRLLLMKDAQISFDHMHYAEVHTDVKKVFGINREKLWNHYMQYGLDENRNVRFL